MTWTRNYDGLLLPSAADSNWTAPSGSGQWSVAGGVLHQGTSSVQYWNNAAVAATDMVFDMMVRVNSTSGSTDDNKMWACWLLLQSSGTDGWGFHLYSDRIKQSANTGGTQADAYVVDMTVYRRVTVRKLGSTQELWVDNVKRYTKTGANANQGTGIWWGQASTGGGSTAADVDYKWWRYASGDEIAPWAGDYTPDAQSGLVLG